jgi:hypothetical protein
MKPVDSDASPPRERFLSRWSRLKRTAAQPSDTAQPSDAAPVTPQAAAGTSVATEGAPATDAVAASAPPDLIASLPPIESLSIESDFSPFFQPKVPEALRRAAVKKLFADPRFNVMDGLDVYIDDYTKSDPIPPEMLKMINHARDLIDHPTTRLAREQAAAAAAGNEGEATRVDAQSDPEAPSGSPPDEPGAIANRGARPSGPAESASPSDSPNGRPAGDG